MSYNHPLQIALNRGFINIMPKPEFEKIDIEQKEPNVRMSSLDWAMDLKASRQHGLSMKRPLIISILVVTAIIVFGLFWMDKTNSEAADEAYAAAKDYIAEESYEEALEKLDEAIKHKDKSIFFYSKYKVLVAENKYNEAGINIDKAYQRESSNAAYAYEAGYFYLNQGQDGQKGLDYLRKAMELDPKNSDYRLTYGSTLAQFSRADEGIKVLEKLIEDDPNYYSVWNDLASLYNYEGHPDKELTTRLEAVRKFPNDAYHWFWLANTYDLQKKKAEAISAYRKSVALDPETGAHASYRIAALSGQKIPEKYREIVEDSIPVVYRNTHAYINASIDGHPGTFLLDTGATDSILYQRYLDRYGLESGDDSPTTQYETAGGIISAPVFYTDMKIGRFTIDNARIAVIPSPKLDKDTDGIIGMNVLKHFNMRMDNLRGTLLFSRK